MTGRISFCLLLPEVDLRSQGSRPRTQKQIRDQGHGQPFRGQTLSRPRTLLLEAKDRGQCRKCFPSPQKKSLKKFSGKSPIYRRDQSFRLGGPKPQITCNDVIKNFLNRNFLMDKDIVGWKI